MNLKAIHQSHFFQLASRNWMKHTHEKGANKCGKFITRGETRRRALMISMSGSKLSLSFLLSLWLEVEVTPAVISTLYSEPVSILTFE